VEAAQQRGHLRPLNVWIGAEFPAVGNAPGHHRWPPAEWRARRDAATVAVIFSPGWRGDRVRSGRARRDRAVGSRGKRTVCTVTVNSADEREVFKKRLPEGDYDFVELVERGRPDWLASACRQGVHCDVLVISGHFDGMTEFYSDRLAMRESLPVAEMERASCSESCPGVFAQLKEVYLFGCNTMNAEPVRSTTAEAERSLVRSGMPAADASRVARALDERHAESSRDHMRRIFTNVPAIYGFTKLAPLGPRPRRCSTNISTRRRPAEFGGGRQDPKLLAQFASSTMVVAGGMTESDPDAQFRRESCQFVDDANPAGRKARVRARSAAARHGRSPDVPRSHRGAVRVDSRKGSRNALVREGAGRHLTGDGATRDRYLRFAEDADLSRTRARMIALAGELRWLTAAEQRAELARMVGDMIARATIGPSDVELFCSLNDDHRLDAERDGVRPTAEQLAKVNNAAALACLGSAEAPRPRIARGHERQGCGCRARAGVPVAPAMTDVQELRGVATGIARMPASGAQIRALDTLARHRLSDGPSLSELARLFPAASVDVQRAIASVLIRGDYHAIAKPEFVHVLAQNRRKSPDGRTSSTFSSAACARRINFRRNRNERTQSPRHRADRRRHPRARVWRVQLHEGDALREDRPYHALGERQGTRQRSALGGIGAVVVGGLILVLGSRKR
jgi:hypothetical protein